MAKYLCDFALRIYNHYNQAHEPGHHIWQSPGPWPDSKCSKIVKVQCPCSESNPCHRKIATDEIQERKNYREHIQRSNIKARVSVH